MADMLAKYEILNELGSGSFATVYRARDTLLNRLVALKILKTAFMADQASFVRFVREAQVTANLFHPHIATVLDMGEADGRHFIAMRYVDGLSLDKVLAQRGPLPWTEALKITEEIAAALDFAHARGLIHRDVKPQNIIISQSEGAVLTDFGLVRAIQSTTLNTATGAMLGTPAYIPSEIWSGQAATLATDQYALACVVAEMLTGNVLFNADNVPAVMMLHVLSGPPFPATWPNGVPSNFTMVLQRALAKEPASRYGDVIALTHALRQPDESIATSPLPKSAIELQAREPEGEAATPLLSQSAVGFQQRRLEGEVIVAPYSSPGGAVAHPASSKSSGFLDKLRQFISPNEPQLSPLTSLPGGYLQPQAVYRCTPPFPRHPRHFYVTDQAGHAFLTHELAAPLHDIIRVQPMALLSGELPSVRRIHDVIGLSDGRTFLLVEPPPRQWHFAADPRDEPVAPELAIEYGLHIGRALVGLQRNGFALNDNTPAALERVVLDGHDAFLVDILACAPLLEDEAQNRQMILADIRFLARLLYRLVTGHHLPDNTQDLRGLARLPHALHVAITLGTKGNYGSLSEMTLNLAGRYLPSLRLTSGKATHPGRIRDHNEDLFFVYETSKSRSDQPLPAFYMVVAGMGGHEASEVASDTISESLKDWLGEFSNRQSGRATQKLGEQPDEALRTAILNANEAVFHEAQTRHNNMGATVTAALIIGEQAFVANVGDSRTYRLRHGELHALTADHSLVYSLYRAQQITLDEIYTHPQRNQIYRSMGEKPNVQVDIFIETLLPGDILLLCSDGLWEMVRDPQLRDIIRSARNPQDAADQLIDAANQGGGEDNITAIIVKVE